MPAPEIPDPPVNEAQDLDTEAKLARMFEIKDEMEQLEVERIALRDTVLPRLKEDGYRWFIDHNGHKRYGSYVAPEPVVVDLDVLREEVSEEIFDEVTVIKLDQEAFKSAVSRGRISRATFLKVAKIKPQKPHIRFPDRGVD